MSNILTSRNWFELVLILYQPLGQFDPVSSRQRDLFKKIKPIKREDSLQSHKNAVYCTDMFA